MDCPQCGNPMEKGHLSAGGYRIFWTPKEHKFSAIAGAEDVKVQPMSWLGENRTEAYICKSCRKMIVDYFYS